MLECLEAQAACSARPAFSGMAIVAMFLAQLSLLACQVALAAGIGGASVPVLLPNVVSKPEVRLT
jgi:hypothetical protein